MSGALEERYRRSLRWYPKNWRRRNEDAALGTLLDRAEDEQRTTPTPGELSDLRASALLTRLGPLGRIPATVRDRVAALALGLGAAISGAGILASLYDTRWIPAAARSQIITIGPFASEGVFLYGLWIVALVLALFGLRRLTNVTLVAAIAVSVILYLIAPVVPFGWTPTLTSDALLGMLAVLVFIGHPARTLRGALRTAISAASWGAAIGFTLWYQHVTKGASAGGPDWFIGPFSEWMGFALPAVLVAAMILWRSTRTPWALAMLIIEAPIAMVAIFGWRDAPTIANELAVLAAVCATLVGCLLLLRGFGLRLRITRV